MARYWMPFMFRNELDILECQLYENSDRIYRYVLVEAALNHQGQAKPLVYEQNKARFARWAGQIIHVIVDWLPPAEKCSDPWVRERLQRDAAMTAMDEAGLRDDDIIVNVDVDEIVGRTALDIEPDPVAGIMLRYFPFAVDWEGRPGANGVMARAWYARQCGLSVLRDMKDMQAVRPYPVIDPGGWHLSWLGGPEEIEDKLHSYCHLETYESASEDNRQNLMYGQGKGAILAAPVVPVDVDATWPRWVYERKCPAIWFRPRETA